MVARTSLISLVLATGLCGETRITLREAGERGKPSFAPAHLERSVTVEGVVPARAIKLLEYSHILIQDASKFGLTLEGSRSQFDNIAPGQYLQVSGVIGMRAGLPVLRPSKLRVLHTEPPPPPQPFSVSELKKVEHLSRYVTVEAYVVTSFENAGGDEVRLDSGIGRLSVFLPRENREGGSGLKDIRPGDRIRATGFSTQYCLLPPYNREFEVMVSRESDVELLSRGWIVRPDYLAYAVAAILLLFAGWWFRERTMARQQRVLRSMMRLSEHVIAAPTPADIARRLEAALPEILGTVAVDVFLFNNSSDTLDKIRTETRPDGVSVKVDAPLGPFTSVIALCFRNNAFLQVPDTRKSPLFDATETTEFARAATLIPLLGQRETMGVLALQFRGGVRKFPPDQQAALQHLGNQIAASLRLQDQQSMREQLLRSERMAASGQLMSGVANDLRSPLQSVIKLVEDMLERRTGPFAETQLREIGFEAKRGVDIVNHLLSFSRTERSEPRPVDIHALLSNIVELREREWTMKGIVAENAIPVSPVYILADQSQLEQVFLNLVLQAEQALLEVHDKRLRATTRLLGRKLQITIDVSCASSSKSGISENLGADSLSWRVSHAIVESHRGDIRLVESEAGCRIEVDFPVYQSSASGSTLHSEPARTQSTRTLTTVLVEPDLNTHRRLLLLLTMRGHRVIPVETAEEAAEMLQRMRFDVIFASARLSGLNWLELFHRVRRRVSLFVLVTDGYDPEAAKTLASFDGQVLAKPFEDGEVDDVLSVITLPTRHGANVT